MDNKLPVEIRNRDLPYDPTKEYQICYDYTKRTSGGFADAVLLGAIIMTGVMWLMLFITVGSRMG